jgi:membrane-associated phospholipid phosphatase
MGTRFSWVAWCIPLIPIGIGAALYFTESQQSTFLAINSVTRLAPDWIWTWITFLGNGWGVFAFSFPLLILAPRALSAGIFAGGVAAIVSALLKNAFNLPRPAGILQEHEFYRIGEAVFHKAMPSGHTLTAFAVASAYFFIVPAEKRKPFILLFIAASAVAISRNAIGAHWLTDVLVGAGLGIWCGLIGAKLAYLLPNKQLSPRSPWLRLIAIGGLASLYVLLNQTLDHPLNMPLQYACIALVLLTLLLFLQQQSRRRI